MEPKQVQPLRVRVDLGLMEMKEYSVLFKISGIRALPSDPVYCLTQDITFVLGGGLIPYRR